MIPMIHIHVQRLFFSNTSVQLRKKRIGLQKEKVTAKHRLKCTFTGILFFTFLYPFLQGAPSSVQNSRSLFCPHINLMGQVRLKNIDCPRSPGQSSWLSRNWNLVLPDLTQPLHHLDSYKLINLAKSFISSAREFALNQCKLNV